MFNLDELLKILDELAPLSLSQAMIDRGDYDNSGLLIKCNDSAKRVLFTMELGDKSLAKAVRNKCDVIVTHHPAIYAPIKNLSVDNPVSSSVMGAIKKDINVISMHLNLDIADGGIDASLCEALGGNTYKIIDNVTELNGYGREFAVDKTILSSFTAKTKKALGTQKIIAYGKKNSPVKKVASFCGAGSSVALKAVADGKTDADVIVTSDMPHHVIKELTERGKCILLVPHYSAEEYGFKKYYERATERLNEKAQTFYFDDKRFR